MSLNKFRYFKLFILVLTVIFISTSCQPPNNSFISDKKFGIKSESCVKDKVILNFSSVDDYANIYINENFIKRIDYPGKESIDISNYLTGIDNIRIEVINNYPYCNCNSDYNWSYTITKNDEEIFSDIGEGKNGPPNTVVYDKTINVISIQSCPEPTPSPTPSPSPSDPCYPGTTIPGQFDINGNPSCCPEGAICTGGQDVTPSGNPSVNPSVDSSGSVPPIDISISPSSGATATPDPNVTPTPQPTPTVTSTPTPNITPTPSPSPSNLTVKYAISLDDNDKGNFDFRLAAGTSYISNVRDTVQDIAGAANKASKVSVFRIIIDELVDPQSLAVADAQTVKDDSCGKTKYIKGVATIPALLGTSKNIYCPVAIDIHKGSALGAIVNTWKVNISKSSDFAIKWEGKDKEGNYLEKGDYYITMSSTTGTDKELGKFHSILPVTIHKSKDCGCSNANIIEGTYSQYMNTRVANNSCLIIKEYINGYKDVGTLYLTPIAMPKSKIAYYWELTNKKKDQLEEEFLKHDITRKSLENSLIKKKGIAYVKLNNGKCRQAELHWYEVEVTGKSFYYYETHVATQDKRDSPWIGNEINCEGIR